MHCSSITTLAPEVSSIVIMKYFYVIYFINIRYKKPNPNSTNSQTPNKRGKQTPEIHIPFPLQKTSQPVPPLPKIGAPPLRVHLVKLLLNLPHPLPVRHLPQILRDHILGRVFRPSDVEPPQVVWSRVWAR